MKKNLGVIMFVSVVLLLTSCGGIESKMQGKWQYVGSKSPSEKEMSSGGMDRIYYFKNGKYLDLSSSSSTEDINWDTAPEYKFKDKRTIVLDGYNYRVYFKDGMMQLVDDNATGSMFGVEWYYKKVK